MSSSEERGTEDVTQISVLASMLLLTVTVERDQSDGDEIHLHPGGQGVWVARAIRSLGAGVAIVAPVGGETGAVVEGLLRQADLDLRAVRVAPATPAYIHDRRSGTRRPVAAARSRSLDRHELDNLYEHFLYGAAEDGLVVVTGRADGCGLPPSFYRRLGSDLDAAGVRVVGDLHNQELYAFLEGGPLEVLKVSDEDLAGDGESIDDDAAVDCCLDRLHGLGARAVVISRADNPSRAVWGGVRYEAIGPRMKTADARGAGDAMTGALAVAVARKLHPADALALASGAGAASVTRHGLASVDAPLIAAMADRISVRVVGECRCDV